ncbi:MAG: exonuclease SbcCD subunit D [Anaeromyxobacteraceae bacterium]
MSLRLLHTSDWHLGRSLHDEPLLEDQAWALERLFALVKDERPDALVVAGDLYDRAVPPPEAVGLLDDFLVRAAELGVPVIAIAGNHDSGERIGFGARLLTSRGVHLRGRLGQETTPIELPGKGFVYALPFVEPEEVRARELDDGLRGHAAATARVLSRVREDAATRALPTVLVAHAFVQGGAETRDSERPLSVGAAGSVPTETLDGFDYVALGHLHEPQAPAERLRYSGSLLKYSFSEAGHRKGVLRVEVERGAARVEEIALGQKRDVVRLRGTLDDLLSRPEHAPHARDLVEATLLDAGYVFDAKRKLERRFAHVLSVTREALAAGPAGEFAACVDGAGNDERKLFDAFLQKVAGAPPTGPEQAVFDAALELVRRAEVER